MMKQTLFYSFMLFQSTLAVGQLTVQVPNLPQLNQELKVQAQALVTRHRGPDLRPEACPLESKKHIDILTKITTIRTLLKENCLDSEQNRIDELLSGAKNIQEELDKAAQALKLKENDETPMQPIANSSNQTGTMQVNGQQIAQLVGGLNDIYKSRACKTLNNNNTFLSEASNIISDFAKVGLLVPNTYSLAIAGGGFALSSILTVLDSLLQRRFNFENTQDRQSFIKLNCAFYDVRRDIEKTGLLDIATNTHKKELGELTSVTVKIEEFWKQVLETDETILKNIDQAKTSEIKTKMGTNFVLLESLGKLEIVLAAEMRGQEQKLQQIHDVSKEFLANKEAYGQYATRADSNSRLLDKMFVDLLGKFDHKLAPRRYTELTEMLIDTYRDGVMHPLLFHAKRVSSVLKSEMDKIEKEFYATVRINQMSYEEYVKNRSTVVAVIKDGHQALLQGLKQSTSRVQRILAEDQVTSLDDGSENTVNILQAYNEIVEQIYGKFGDEFMQYTTKTSWKNNKQFIKKFKKFAKQYLITQDRNGKEMIKIPESDEIGELQVKFACQDARPYRARWKYADALAQQGYDFVATNGDLFHSDIRRPFLGKSGGRHGIHDFNNRFERIQKHYRSAIFAKKKLQGKPLAKDEQKLLNDKKFVGRSILALAESKKSSQILQDLIEKYNCLTSTALE